MKNAIAGMFSSKKFLVFISTTLVTTLVVFGGLPEEQATEYVDKLIKLAMAYMGGQGVADAGKYFGAAMGKARSVVEPISITTTSTTVEAAPAPVVIDNGESPLPPGKTAADTDKADSEPSESTSS